MIVETRIFYANAQGKRAQNVLHWQTNGTPSSSDPFVIAQAVEAAFDLIVRTALLNCLCADTILAAYTSKVVDGSGGPTFAIAIGVVGLETGVSLSMIVAANITLLPGAPPYQRKEGHLYVPAMPELFCDGDLIQAAGNTAYAALATALQNGFMANGVTWFQVIYDRTLKLGTVISDYVLKPNVSGHRRRIRPVTG